MRKQEPDAPLAALRWFSVRGVVDGIAVRAHWESGILACDEPLQRRLALAASVDEIFASAPDPLEGISRAPSGRAGVVTLLTLVHSCDSLTNVEFEMAT